MGRGIYERRLDSRCVKSGAGDCSERDRMTEGDEGFQAGTDPESFPSHPQRGILQYTVPEGLSKRGPARR